MVLKKTNQKNRIWLGIKRQLPLPPGQARIRRFNLNVDCFFDWEYYEVTFCLTDEQIQKITSINKDFTTPKTSKLYNFITNWFKDMFIILSMLKAGGVTFKTCCPDRNSPLIRTYIALDGDILQQVHKNCLSTSNRLDLLQSHSWLIHLHLENFYANVYAWVAPLLSGLLSLVVISIFYFIKPLLFFSAIITNLVAYLLRLIPKFLFFILSLTKQVRYFQNNYIKVVFLLLMILLIVWGSYEVSKFPILVDLNLINLLKTNNQLVWEIALGVLIGIVVPWVIQVFVLPWLLPFIWRKILIPLIVD